jgi:hypothetical protein
MLCVFDDALGEEGGRLNGFSILEALGERAHVVA